MTQKRQKHTYTLYRSHFDTLAKILAYYETGQFQIGWDLLVKTLEQDRPDIFDSADLAEKIGGYKYEILRLKPDAEDLFTGI
jgi:hypothetical protein